MDGGWTSEWRPPDSPAFTLGGEISKELELKFILQARGFKIGQRNSCFKHAGGIGNLSLKSDGASWEGSASGVVAYRISVGNSSTGWLVHDFMKIPLLRCGQEWNFHKAVDKTTKHVNVRLEITSPDL